MMSSSVKTLLIGTIAVLVLVYSDATLLSRTRRRKPLAPHVSSASGVGTLVSSPRSIANLTCGFVEQPLNHFALPRDSSPTFQQRYCISNEFVVHPHNATVFLYTGNESPLEQYINNTGLMWELAESLQAQILFIEHRYEGQSLPSPDIPHCMAYSSSIQAIADYAHLVEKHLWANGTTIAHMQRRPVSALCMLIIFVCCVC